ncbi:hypothetical protein BDN72DRAFT_496722 [Pluteus cervinus]|uniref:Uncharacterized protein n=1 Tax=Pluteus cervinus TaxID=181527 RepID=A0ACD3AYW1_9AGAR|nr:hypothetical protein BDN72DRAFT_496722 [Pluteus cervinus]
MKILLSISNHDWSRRADPLYCFAVPGRWDVASNQASNSNSKRSPQFLSTLLELSMYFVSSGRSIDGLVSACSGNLHIGLLSRDFMHMAWKPDLFCSLAQVRPISMTIPLADNSYWSLTATSRDSVVTPVRISPAGRTIADLRHRGSARQSTLDILCRCTLSSVIRALVIYCYCFSALQ